MKKDRRHYILNLIGKINQTKCDATPIYGEDLRDTLSSICNYRANDNLDNLSFLCRSSINCHRAIYDRTCDYSLTTAVKSLKERVKELDTMFKNYVLFVPAVCAPTPQMNVYHQNPSNLNRQNHCETILRDELSPQLTIFHPIISAMSTQVIEILN